MHSRLGASLLVAGAIVAATPYQAHADDAAMAICQATANEYIAAIGSGDPANVAKQYVPDGELIAPEGIFQGTQAIATYLAAFVKPGVKDVDVLKSAHQMGETILCTGDFVLTLPPGFPAREATGHFSKVLTRAGGVWHYAQLTFNYTPMPASPPDK